MRYFRHIDGRCSTLKARSTVCTTGGLHASIRILRYWLKIGMHGGGKYNGWLCLSEFSFYT
eukprot:314192-Amphidinium_carterae.1